jgi:VIT1/CCC1 family predicted Fe2+/Mn2+ transporter
MPQTPHVEKHFTASAVVRDIVIGMSDGLTVPFALAAGLSGAVNTPNATAVVITAGLAEVAAGSIAMGLGGYLAARTDAEHYATERAVEVQETIEVPDREADEVAEVFRSYGLPEETVATVVKAISSNQNRWVDFMMKFELGLEKPDPRRAGRSALTIAGSYIVGGLIPLAPYFFIHSIRSALKVSVVVTLIALLTFGYVKGRFTVKSRCAARGKRSSLAGWRHRRRSYWPNFSASSTAQHHTMSRSRTGGRKIGIAHDANETLPAKLGWRDVLGAGAFLAAAFRVRHFLAFTQFVERHTLEARRVEKQVFFLARVDESVTLVRQSLDGTFRHFEHFPS